MCLLGLDVLDGNPVWEVMAGDRWMARHAWKLLHASGEEPRGHAVVSLVLFSMSAVLFFANFVFIGLGVIACAQRRLPRLIPFALLAPLYWFLVSIGALRGFLQLFTNPHKWEKTHHIGDPPIRGGHDGRASPRREGKRSLKPRSRMPAGPPLRRHARERTGFGMPEAVTNSSIRRVGSSMIQGRYGLQWSPRPSRRCANRPGRPALHRDLPGGVEITFRIVDDSRDP